jgi:hypothetical protein
MNVIVRLHASATQIQVVTDSAVAFTCQYPSTDLATVACITNLQCFRSMPKPNAIVAHMTCKQLHDSYTTHSCSELD